MDPKDIELVMAQVNCSRAKAVRVLKENNNDLITASTYPSKSSDPDDDGRQLIVPLAYCFLVMAASE